MARTNRHPLATMRSKAGAVAKAEMMKAGRYVPRGGEEDRTPKAEGADLVRRNGGAA